jgi:hypothetical protein
MTATLDKIERHLRKLGRTEDAAAIVRLRVENQTLSQQVSEMRGIIEAFLGGDPKMTPMIGGNPNYVEAFLERARSATILPLDDPHKALHL